MKEEYQITISDHPDEEKRDNAYCVILRKKENTHVAAEAKDIFGLMNICAQIIQQSEIDISK